MRKITTVGHDESHASGQFEKTPILECHRQRTMHNVDDVASIAPMVTQVAGCIVNQADLYISLFYRTPRSPSVADMGIPVELSSSRCFRIQIPVCAKFSPDIYLENLNWWILDDELNIRREKQLHFSVYVLPPGAGLPVAQHSQRLDVSFQPLPDEKQPVRAAFQPLLSV